MCDTVSSTKVGMHSSRRALAFPFAPLLTPLACFGLACFGVGCSGSDAPSTLLTDAPVSVSTVYSGIQFRDSLNNQERAWLPTELAGSPSGELWVLQRAERLGDFSDPEECPTALFDGEYVDNDCGALLGSTVAISAPSELEPATTDNGRALLVEDSNSWHFMRRPSGIAFGDLELTIEPGDPGSLVDMNASAEDPENWLIDEPVTYTETFATCIEHRTANATDGSRYVGPTLWTSDPEIYDGTDGIGGNGSHLDMVHATAYCMGIAYEGADNTYWLFNGELGTLDRYDFGVPHVDGHHYHGDAVVDRYYLAGEGLARVPNVPSNMVVDANGTLYIADTGNARILAVDTTPELSASEQVATFEGSSLMATVFRDLAARELATAASLSETWGATVEPSGLALLDDDTLVVANHGSGHLSLLGTDGTLLRTIDTGLGAGLGGLTVLEGTIYFVHLSEEKVYRLDVE